jgi:ABC-2 type transport system ATP-binding protein
MKPSRGTVTVFGHEPGSDPAKMLTGAVIQETALYDRLSARDNLRMYAALYPSIRKEDRPRVVDAALRLADLAHEAGKRAGDLSGGMARRLQIARALQHSPQLIILDEPTLGVDPVQRAALWEHIRWLRDTGRTVLLTTNQMDEAAALCDRIAIIHAGRLVALDTPANLQRGRGAVITVTAEAIEEDLRQAYKALCADPDITHVTVTHGAGPRLYQVQVTAGGGDGITGKVIMHLTDSEVVIRDVDTRKATLDEVFLAVTGSFQAAR